MTFFTSSPEETILLGEKIGSKLKCGDVIALQGTLAAGKTTITKGIARSLGVDDTITSPTFCIISEYEGKIPLYHLDVYRLEGADDLIYGNGVCLIEWSEKIMNELPSSTIILRLETVENEENSNKRKITLENWNYGDL